jgi:hypothetical protein
MNPANANLLSRLGFTQDIKTAKTRVPPSMTNNVRPMPTVASKSTQVSSIATTLKTTPSVKAKDPIKAPALTAKKPIEKKNAPKTTNTKPPQERWLTPKK